jgi:putative MFS transporter
VADPAFSGASATRLEAAVGAVLDDLKTIRIRFYTPILLGLIMLFDSWDAISIAYGMPAITQEWGLSPLDVGVMFSAGYSGQFIGALALGAVAERFGRMPVILWAIGVMSVLALACAFAPSHQALLAIRFVQGIAIGGALPVAATYINELAPTKSRALYFTIYQMIAMSGYSLASTSSGWIVPHLGWRWLLGIGAVPILLLPLAILTLPESPRWLARNGFFDKANRALAKLGGGPATAPAAIIGESEAIEPRLRMVVLFGKEFRPRTILITLLWFLTSFANFGLIIWTPSIFVSQFHFPLTSALLSASIGSTTMLVFTPFAGAIMDRIGRRPLAIGGALLGAIMMAVLTLHRPTNDITLVAMLVVGQMGIATCTLVLWPFTVETYPTTVRALALGYSSSIARGAALLTPLVAGYILNAGAAVEFVFATYGICSLATFVIWITMTRETKRKALDAI